MTIDLDTRRSIRQIAREDFAAYPVWEWALNDELTQGHGESFVRPSALASLPLGLACHYIVSATAILSDGSALPACVDVAVRGKKVKVEPMFIFLQDRHLDFGGAVTRTVLSHYTKQPHARPVSWELAVPIDGQAAPLKGAVRRSLAERMVHGWRRLSGATRRDSVLVP